jgi:flagellar operon protein (TIGR03826 family)
MALRNCPECGKIFTFIRTNLCPECQQKDEDSFNVVRKFIAQNPGVNIAIVSEQTGISEDNILRYLKDGRLTSKHITQTMLKCELCGCAISSGRHCQACQDRITAGLKKVINEENARQIAEMNSKNSSQGPRMHTTETQRKRNS